MNKIIDYCIIKKHTPDECIHWVKKLINEGWQPLVGVNVLIDIDIRSRAPEDVFYQAMVMYDDADRLDYEALKKRNENVVKPHP